MLASNLYVKSGSIQSPVNKVVPRANTVSDAEISKMNSEPNMSVRKIIGAKFQEIQRILFLGNSISLHGLTKEVDWNHISGVAASSEDNDYVHILVRLLSEDWKAESNMK